MVSRVCHGRIMAEARPTCVPDLVKTCVYQVSRIETAKHKSASDEHGMGRNERIGSYWTLRTICKIGNLWEAGYSTRVDSRFKYNTMVWSFHDLFQLKNLSFWLIYHTPDLLPFLPTNTPDSAILAETLMLRTYIWYMHVVDVCDEGKWTFIPRPGGVWLYRDLVVGGYF